MSAVLLGLALAGGPATADSQGKAPSEESAGFLREMRDQLAKARLENSPRKANQALDRAESEKTNFIGSVYMNGGQDLLGCSSRSSFLLFQRLEDLDLELQMAGLGEAERRENRLGSAEIRGERTAAHVATCPEAGETERVIAGEIASRAKSLSKSHLNGELGERELKKGINRIASLKRRLLANQQIYDCDAFRILALVEEIDLPLLQAEEEGERGRRDRLAGKALRSAEDLIELWKRAPCDTDCEDRKDNDGDGSVDIEDPGCLAGPLGAYDRSDRSEQHGVSTDLNCSGLVTGTTRDVFISHPNAGSAIIRHVLRNVTRGELLVERSSDQADFSLGGPVELGTRVCGPGTTASAEWVRNGLTMSWHLTVTKTNQGVVPPAHSIVAAADTR